MPLNLKRLVDVGFVHAGRWNLVDDKLSLQLDERLASSEDLLYAFVCDGELTYVGKTTKSLLIRMNAYKKPPKNTDKGGTTNKKNNENIRRNLELGGRVDIYTWKSLTPVTYGEFEASAAASLEDALIRTLNPPWNGRAKARSSPSKTAALSPAKLATPTISQHLDPNENEPNQKLSVQVFQLRIGEILCRAKLSGIDYLDLNSGDLHRLVGGYPGKNHAMPSCCSAMRKERGQEDEILEQPPKNNGARLTIRYHLADRISTT